MSTKHSFKIGDRVQWTTEYVTEHVGGSTVRNITIERGPVITIGPLGIEVENETDRERTLRMPKDLTSLPEGAA